MRENNKEYLNTEYISPPKVLINSQKRKRKRQENNKKKMKMEWKILFCSNEAKGH
jgi:hypothetical protein